MLTGHLIFGTFAKKKITHLARALQVRLSIFTGLSCWLHGAKNYEKLGPKEID
jgi:hypothetical protein